MVCIDEYILFESIYDIIEIIRLGKRITEKYDRQMNKIPESKEYNIIPNNYLKSFLSKLESLIIDFNNNLGCQSSPIDNINNLERDYPFTLWKDIKNGNDIKLEERGDR